jgi:Ca2+/Na+ antiporter
MYQAKDPQKEIFIKTIALISTIICFCAAFLYFNSGKASDLIKVLFAIFYMIYFVIIISDGD